MFDIKCSWFKLLDFLKLISFWVDRHMIYKHTFACRWSPCSPFTLIHFHLRNFLLHLQHLHPIFKLVLHCVSLCQSGISFLSMGVVKPISCPCLMVWQSQCQHMYKLLDVHKPVKQRRKFKLFFLLIHTNRILLLCLLKAVPSSLNVFSTIDLFHQHAVKIRLILGQWLQSLLSNWKAKFLSQDHPCSSTMTPIVESPPHPVCNAVCHLLSYLIGYIHTHQHCAIVVILACCWFRSQILPCHWHRCRPVFWDQIFVACMST